MDPVVVIVTALAAGAGSAVQDETPDAVKSAYAWLRDAVRQRLAGHPDGEMALVLHEADPQAGRLSLAGELARAGAGNDADLVAAALVLLKLADKAKEYQVTVSGSQGVQVGDHNVQVSYFAGESGDQRRVAGAAVSAGGAAAGRLLSEVTDPFALEVHRPVRGDDLPSELPILPSYIPRDHDHELMEAVRAAADGASGIAVLVGGSSTGKTRACWEALGLLRERPEGWRLWHPIDPTRPEAALRDLPLIAPRTVIWLNEAQFYLDTPVSGLGEQVAAGLRELLRSPERAPVLVLATMWPEFWGRLTARPPGTGDDPHAQSRELLTGRGITVPAAFTPAQLPLLAAAGDPRLALAAHSAEDGQVIQFLAGAPELIARYRNAPPAAAALIDAAMDGRRLGMGTALPLDFLKAAAPGYLTDSDWDTLSEDWLGQALAYTTAPCKGARGPLSRIRPRVTNHSPKPAYRLADYLDQNGRRTRQDRLAPASLWEAVAAQGGPGDLGRVGDAAYSRGLYRHAAILWTRAIAEGNPDPADDLISLVGQLDPDDGRRVALWTASHAVVDNSHEVPTTLRALRETSTKASAVTAARTARETNLDDPVAIASLLQELRQAGARAAVGKLLARNPFPRVSLDDPTGIAVLLAELREAGARDAAAVLAARVASEATLNEPTGLTKLLQALREIGTEDAFLALAMRAAAHTALDDPSRVAELLKVLCDAGAGDAVARLLTRGPAIHVRIGDPVGVTKLLRALRETDAPEAACVLAGRAASGTTLDDPTYAAELLRALGNAGISEAVSALAGRAARQSNLDPWAVGALLRVLYGAGFQDAVSLLATRAARHAVFYDVSDIWALLKALQEVGAEEAISTLVIRVARQASLTDAGMVTGLLWLLEDAGAQEAVTVLATRAADQVSLHNSRGVARLLQALRESGATPAVTKLLDRAPAQHADINHPEAIGELIAALEQAGAGDAASNLAARAAAQANLDNPIDVAELLMQLLHAGRQDAAAKLLARDPATRASLDDAVGVDELLRALRQARSNNAAAVLAKRAANGGMFDLYLKENPEDLTRYKFGREPSGIPSKPWEWREPAIDVPGE